MKEKEPISVGKSIVKCSEDLELKKKQLDFIQNSAEKLSKEHESNKLQLHLIQTLTTASLRELKEKETILLQTKNNWKNTCKSLK